jgi:hypothetical protein
MPASSINDPEHWRARAEEMRRLAEDINDAATKEMMLRIARDYETLAVRAEERSRPPKVDWPANRQSKARAALAGVGGLELRNPCESHVFEMS